ncbi:hypothetical protein BX600DRAFT_512636 [Xylariales sp. PMI_506]|nr:hypothetical protein BX600DRAFT_512636 [Xylariales sp. PMI_506]
MESQFSEEFVLLGLGHFVILARFSARIGAAGVQKLALDDYLMGLAACIYVMETLLAWSVVAIWHGLANNGLTDMQRAAIAVGSEEFLLRVGGSKTQIAGQNSYTALLWTMKCSVCCFYSRLLENLQGYKSAICFGFVIIITTWLTVHLTLLAGCYPFSKYWQINPDPGVSCQAAISHVFILTSVILDIATDAYLLSIPLPMLWRANMTTAKKFGLTAIFSGAIFVMAAALVRCIMIMTDPVDGAANSATWACRETFVSVVTSNLPVIWSSVSVLVRKRGRGWYYPWRPSQLSAALQDTNGNPMATNADALELGRLSSQALKSSAEIEHHDGSQRVGIAE